MADKDVQVDDAVVVSETASAAAPVADGAVAAVDPVEPVADVPTVVDVAEPEVIPTPVEAMAAAETGMKSDPITPEQLDGDALVAKAVQTGFNNGIEAAARWIEGDSGNTYLAGYIRALKK